MRIDPDACTDCGVCLDYCPAGALEQYSEDSYGGVRVVQELCSDCGLCQRLTLCPADAFIESEDANEFPRNIRALFSNPHTTHKLTMVPGRGTEESKTNDVTGRIRRGEAGICIEFGRPGLGSTFGDVSIMTTRLKALGLEFEQKNPLTQLMDAESGRFPDSLVHERILSSIIEIKLGDLYDLKKVIPVILDVAKQIDTVFSLSVVTRFEPSGELPALGLLSELGIACRPNAKVNLGLGRPLVEL